MIKTIKIKTQKASAKVLSSLEKKGLIRVIRPTAKVLNTRTKTGAIDVFYRSSEGSGGHCLLAVGKRSVKVQFSFHGDNEDLVLLRPGKRKYKKLFLVLSFLKSAKFLKALREEKLGPGDLTAVELEFNKPETMFFTLLKHTVHCEVTLPGAGAHPVFFVTEPARLKMNRVKSDKYKFSLIRK